MNIDYDKKLQGLKERRDPDDIDHDHYFEEALENAYWHFDDLRNKGNLSERDVFKQIVRGIISQQPNIKQTTKSNKPWYGFDLDGTLAYWDGWKGIQHIGEPIPRMVQRLKDHIAKGDDCRILTARAANPDAIPFVQEFLVKINVPPLPITNEKDTMMECLYDDRVKQVQPNTGILIEDLLPGKTFR